MRIIPLKTRQARQCFAVKSITFMSMENTLEATGNHLKEIMTGYLQYLSDFRFLKHI